MLAGDTLATLRRRAGRTQAEVAAATGIPADIEAMVASNAIDLQLAAERLGGLLGDDPRVGRLRTLTVRP
jgi:transcriptional regulator with XRE-family HTH domain